MKEFIDNKYKKIYFKIVDQASRLNRVKSETHYYENHHILPKSLGGYNDKSNLVLLTAREHYICHWLLINMTEDKSLYLMQHCFWSMNNQNKTGKRYANSKGYEISRRAFSKLNKNKTISSDHKEKNRKAQLGKKATDTAKEKMRLAKLGKTRKPHSEETKNKIRQSNTGNVCSEETKKKLSIYNKSHFIKPPGRKGCFVVINSFNERVWLNKDEPIPLGWETLKSKKEKDLSERKLLPKKTRKGQGKGRTSNRKGVKLTTEQKENMRQARLRYLEGIKNKQVGII